MTMVKRLTLSPHSEFGARDFSPGSCYHQSLRNCLPRQGGSVSPRLHAMVHRIFERARPWDGRRPKL